MLLFELMHIVLSANHLFIIRIIMIIIVVVVVVAVIEVVVVIVVSGIFTSARFTSGRLPQDTFTSGRLKVIREGHEFGTSWNELGLHVPTK